MNQTKVLSGLIESRKRKNLTQEELAKKANVSRSLVANIERGAADPSLKSAYRIALVLEESIEDVFFSHNVHKMNKNDST